MIGATLVTVASATDNTGGRLRITVTNWLPPAPMMFGPLLAGDGAPDLEPIELLEDPDK